MATGVAKVDPDKCIGCGACTGTCPAVFQIGASGKAEAGPVEAANEADIQAAVDGCPVGAITYKKA